jgi:hypothetical protein
LHIVLVDLGGNSGSKVDEESAGAYSDDDSEDEFLDDYADEKISEAAFTSVVDAIDRLFRISIRIRNPKTRTGSSKAFQYRNVDPDTNVDLIDSFRQYDRGHIEELFTQSQGIAEGEKKSQIKNAFLVDRFSQANIKRRQQFAYWNDHRLKHARRTERARQQMATNANTVPELIQREHTPMRIPAVSEHSKPTTATYLDARKVRIDEDVQSVSTVASAFTIAAMDDDQDVQFPAPPQQYASQKTLKEFECPYCFTICSTKDLRPLAWK